ncbi:MAG TPA: zinc ribbon domain-containing protein [Sedimentisphaerales bacterium]|nr:zinc ribbon domain-containing protein [Sedimentisphaerales bacterium]HOV77490.1 zinc ribbon domain-containing protein [Sedimentisphaerales bacterium]
MPTYEYACMDCEHRFEEFQSITAKPLRKCPQCNRMSLKRLIGTGAGILFKGSGFYCTDYRNEGSKKTDDPGVAKEKPAEKTEAKTENKPAPVTASLAKTESGNVKKKKSA